MWFPFYPLCMEHCITRNLCDGLRMLPEMIGLYGGGNVSTCGFSSGGALALGIAAHNNAQPERCRSRDTSSLYPPARCRERCGKSADAGTQ